MTTMKVSGRYVLVDKTPMPCEDLDTWAKWFESAERRVGLTEVGKRSVSTVFLGLDHSFGDGPPKLFETMIFDEQGKEIWCQRASTWDEAEACHRRAIIWATNVSAA